MTKNTFGFLIYQFGLSKHLDIINLRNKPKSAINSPSMQFYINKSGALWEFKKNSK